MTEADAPIDLDVSGGPQPVPPRSRQRWYWAGGAVALVAAVAIAVAGIGPTHAPHRPPPGPPPPSSGPLAWIDALVDGPARGALARDPAFARDLPDRITQMLQQAGSYPLDLYALDGTWHADQEVRLLFADDIGTQRVVLVALRLPMAEAPTTAPTDALDPVDPSMAGNRTKVVQLVGPRGASVSSLLSYLALRPADGVSVGSMPATPFILAQASNLNEIGTHATVGLAPPGCTVATARTTDPDTFVDEPTGSYIVRTESTYRAEVWRVTCGGTVHAQQPAPVYFHPMSVGDVEAAVVGAAGLSPADAQRTEVQEAVAQALIEINSRSSELTGSPQIIWAGAPQIDPDVTADQPFAVVAAAPAVPSGWFVVVWFGSLAGGYASTLGSALVHADTDPTVAVVAAPLQLVDRSAVLVLVPRSARGVRLQTPAGAVARDAVLTSRAAVLTLPADSSAQIVQPYDETGTPVTAPVPIFPLAPTVEALSDWSGTPVIPG